jgi:hypothetical protein
MFPETHASWLQSIAFHFHDLMNLLCPLDHHLLMHLVVQDLCRSQFHELRYCSHKVLVA